MAGCDLCGEETVGECLLCEDCRVDVPDIDVVVDVGDRAAVFWGDAA